MSAIFNFQSLLTVILLLICTCTYIRSLMPNLFDKRLGKVGVLFGNVLGLVKEKVHMWLFVASVWPLVFYFGRNISTWVILVNAFVLYECDEPDNHDVLRGKADLETASGAGGAFLDRC